MGVGAAEHVSYQTLYENLQRGEVASAERDHDAELILIDKEDIGSDPVEAELLSAPSALPSVTLLHAIGCGCGQKKQDGDQFANSRRQ